jgi:DivIVA domain-containing protein
MGITGWIFIVGGAAMAGRAVPQLVRARRSQADAIAAGAWSSLVVGLGSLASGGLYLSDRGTGWYWLTVTLLVAGLITLIAEQIVSRRRTRRPGRGTADVSGPGPANAPDARTVGLIERITNVRFGTVRLAPGYDEQEVDIFLDQLVATLSQDGQLDRSRLRDARFSTTRIRPGYAMADVDTFLDEVAHAAW